MCHCKIISTFNVSACLHAGKIFFVLNVAFFAFNGHFPNTPIRHLTYISRRCTTAAGAHSHERAAKPSSGCTTDRHSLLAMLFCNVSLSLKILNDLVIYMHFSKTSYHVQTTAPKRQPGGRRASARSSILTSAFGSFLFVTLINVPEEMLETFYSKNFKSISKSYMRPGQSVT